MRRHRRLIAQTLPLIRMLAQTLPLRVRHRRLAAVASTALHSEYFTRLPFTYFSGRRN
jgi:hypothetical protein